MDRWDIMRHWLILNQSNPLQSIARVTTSALKDYRACCALGAAGLGKTFELNLLAEIEESEGAAVRFERAGKLATSAEGFEKRLLRLSQELSDRSAIYLDAIDEAMVPVKTAGIAVAHWIREELSEKRPRLRLSCRSAVWPSEVASAVADVYGEEDWATASLEPMSEDDIRRVASDRRLDAEAFLRAVHRSRVYALAVQPLTLDMLLKVFEKGQSLPGSRRDLFLKGISILSSERYERRSISTGIAVPQLDLIDGAERLACLLLLAGREVVNLGDFAEPTDLGIGELGMLPSHGRPIDDELLRGIASSGLCSGVNDARFGFAHRQLTEYLAGRRIARLPLHQAKALLASPVGWRAGVAGPVRETAAFAAMESNAIAAWIAECDPEVVGLSDVAEASLRRQAMLGLLEQLRKHEISDSQVMLGRLELAGFQYAGADDDLRAVLRERKSPGASQEVLEGAIKLIDTWQLASLSDELADLVLDNAAPPGARRSAGYALSKFGTAEARHRLKPLIRGTTGESDLDLKGLALRNNWPANLTVPELLSALSSPGSPNRLGAYEGFLFDLDRRRFDAEGYLVEGLEWAGRFQAFEDYDSLSRIAKRIAHRSLDHLAEPGIADALVRLLLTSTRRGGDSVLTPIRDLGLSNPPDAENPPAVFQAASHRRLVLSSLAKAAVDSPALWSAVHGTPSLLNREDFGWLLERATDASMDLAMRRRYAELARMLNWFDDHDSIEAWLRVREIEPVCSTIHIPLSVELRSAAAAESRKLHRQMKRADRPKRRRLLRPPPRERVQEVLRLAETKDVKFFLNLSRELTLAKDSTRYGFSRILTNTPGWAEADFATRSRIVEAAKRLLSEETDEPERSRTEPLSSVLSGYMEAVWLLMDQDPGWLDSRSESWWTRWAWYFLRELRPNMSEESDSPKLSLAASLHRHAPAAVRNIAVELAGEQDEHSRRLLESIFEMIDPLIDADLNRQLCELVSAGAVSKDRVTIVSEFVLGRDSERATAACLARLDPAATMAADESAAGVALALLQERTAGAWDAVYNFLNVRRDLAARVLADFAHNYRFRWRSTGSAGPQLDWLSPARAAQLVGLLIELFPPETDPPLRGASFVGPDDSARELRTRLLSALSSQDSADAVVALRGLEARFSTKYPWLRRLRADANRLHRLANWSPIPPISIAKVLGAGTKLLIRSEADARDGVLEALHQYLLALRQDTREDLEDLWNLPKKQLPTPKEEEHISKKICHAIRDYFQGYAVTADREVQVFRRKLAVEMGGAPGSEVDVLVSVPAAGEDKSDRIAIPIEVKRSNNPEANTGMRSQLADRYMSQLGTRVGVFVVAWLWAPRLPRSARPIWPNISAAKASLDAQAAEITASFPEGTVVTPIVLDASLTRTEKLNPRLKHAAKKRKVSSRNTGTRRSPVKRTGARRAKKAPWSGRAAPKRKSPRAASGSAAKSNGKKRSTT